MSEAQALLRRRQPPQSHIGRTSMHRREAVAPPGPRRACHWQSTPRQSAQRQSRTGIDNSISSASAGKSPRILLAHAAHTAFENRNRDRQHSTPREHWQRRCSMHAAGTGRRLTIQTINVRGVYRQSKTGADLVGAAGVDEEGDAAVDRGHKAGGAGALPEVVRLPQRLPHVRHPHRRRPPPAHRRTIHGPQLCVPHCARHVKAVWPCTGIAAANADL